MRQCISRSSCSCRLRLCTKYQIEEIEEHKAKTAESKAEVDATSLQLQNLLYEKNYYIKEIATSKNFEYVLAYRRAPYDVLY